jgi:excisionase family DNA binding protein
MVETRNWLTIPEIAAEYAISRQTIWRLVKDKKLASQRIGHLYRIKRENWTAYLQKCNQEGQYK